MGWDVEGTGARRRRDGGVEIRLCRSSVRGRGRMVMYGGEGIVYVHGGGDRGTVRRRSVVPLGTGAWRRTVPKAAGSTTWCVWGGGGGKVVGEGGSERGGGRGNRGKRGRGRGEKWR